MNNISRQATSLVYLALASLLPAASLPAQAVPPAQSVYSLEDAIRISIERSQLVSQADARVHSAGQQVREAWGEVYPNIVADGSYTRNLKVPEQFLPAFIFDPTAPPDALVPVRFGADNSWTAGIRVDQKLFELDVFIGLGAAERFRRVEEERRRGTVQSVVGEVRQAYLDALLAREQTRLVTESVDRTRESLGETRALQRAGLASSYDVLRLEVQLANLEPNLRRAMNLAAAADRQLLVQMGLQPGSEIQLEGNLGTIDVERPELNDAANARLFALAGVSDDQLARIEQLYSTAVEQRSDLREVELTASLERSRLASNRAEYFPTVSLFGNYRVNSQQNGSVDFFGNPDNRTTFADVGIRVEVPIFQGFKRAARAQQTQATLTALEAQRDRLEQVATGQIQTLVADIDEARERAVAQRRAVAQAQRGFEIASIEYREGLGSQLQITDSEVALRESEFNYADAVYDYLSARARLEAAIGAVPDGADALATRLASR